MDDRLDPSGGYARQHLELVLRRPAIAADDVELERPDVAEVSLGVVAGGGAAGQQAALQLEGAEALGPGLAAGVVDDDVDPAAAPGPRLAVEAMDLGDVVLRLGVDHQVGAELLEARRLPFAAGTRDDLAADRLGELDAAGAAPAA